MTRTRLRDSRTPEQEQAFYADRYPGGYRHAQWTDHVERVDASVGFLHPWTTDMRSVADLSCGDAEIVRRLHLPVAVLGDLNGAPYIPGMPPGITAAPPGPLPDTLEYLSPMDPVDLYVCSETLEHLDDPDGFLSRLPALARHLFVSTPVAETRGQGNEEHYWSWDVDDLRTMLTDAGWLPRDQIIFTPVSVAYYTFQFWFCSRVTTGEDEA